MITQQQSDLIEKLMRRHNVPVLYPGEHGYITLAAHLLVKEINQWFLDNGVPRKVRFYSARAWLNRSFPDWVLVGLNQRLKN